MRAGRKGCVYAAYAFVLVPAPALIFIRPLHARPCSRYKPGGSSAKRIWLPASNPGEGSDGADVLLVCDPEYDNLLHLHK